MSWAWGGVLSDFVCYSTTFRFPFHPWMGCDLSFFLFRADSKHNTLFFLVPSLSLLGSRNDWFYSVVFCYFFVILISHFCVRYLDYDEFGRDEFSFGNRTLTNGVDREGPVLSKLGSSSTTELHPKAGAHGDSKPVSMPPASVMSRLILIMVWRKLIRNPNTYSSLIGLTWSLVSFKYVEVK